MTIMSNITVKKRLLTRTVEGTDRRGEDSCSIRAKTRVFSGFWKYEVAVDTPSEALRTSGHFLQVLHDMKTHKVSKPWLDLLGDVAGEVCDRFGSATAFFNDEQMQVIAALKGRDMSIAALGDLLSMNRGKAFEALRRLEDLDIVLKDDFSAPDVSEKTYRLNGIGTMIHGLLMEDRKYALIQATVDSKLASGSGGQGFPPIAIHRP